MFAIVWAIGAARQKAFADALLKPVQTVLVSTVIFAPATVIWGVLLPAAALLRMAEEAASRAPADAARRPALTVATDLFGKAAPAQVPHKHSQLRKTAAITERKPELVRPLVAAVLAGRGALVRAKLAPERNLKLYKPAGIAEHKQEA